jgi:DNA-binding MarR family transcriptional regulator
MDKAQSQIPDLPCLCASFRRTARALTQFYDVALRPLGLRTTQFTVLQALTLTGEVSQGRLGEILALDSTTLTRTLAIMRRRGWIQERRGLDARERLISLAKRGEMQFERARPAWQKAQERLKDQFGEAEWKRLFRENREMTVMAKGGTP